MRISMSPGPKITAEQYSLEELRRAYIELGISYHFEDLPKAIEQAKKNRIYDDAMKAHDSRPDLREHDA